MLYKITELGKCMVYYSFFFFYKKECIVWSLNLSSSFLVSVIRSLKHYLLQSWYSSSD
jgi:hypothetical protein